MRHLPAALGLLGILAGATFLSGSYPGHWVQAQTPASPQLFHTPTPASGPQLITLGPNGNEWFTEFRANKIGEITPTGSITEFAVPTAGAQPYGIAAGPDGALWFSESNVDKIGRITSDGKVSEFSLPPSGTSKRSDPGEIVTGSDGNLWFSETQSSRIGRITPMGAISEFPTLTPSASPEGITAGPDGNLWFTEETASKIARITPAGVVSEFPTPTASSGPYGITAGVDGMLYFTEIVSSQIGRIATDGKFTGEFRLPKIHTVPLDIRTAPNGELFVSEVEGNDILEVTVSSAGLQIQPLSLWTEANALPMGLDITTNAIYVALEGTSEIAAASMNFCGGSLRSFTLAQNLHPRQSTCATLTVTVPPSPKPTSSPLPTQTPVPSEFHGGFDVHITPRPRTLHTTGRPDIGFDYDPRAGGSPCGHVYLIQVLTMRATIDGKPNQLLRRTDPTQLSGAEEMEKDTTAAGYGVDYIPAEDSKTPYYDAPYTSDFYGQVPPGASPSAYGSPGNLSGDSFSSSSLGDAPNVSDSAMPAGMTRITMYFEVAAFCADGDDKGKFFAWITWVYDKQRGKDGVIAISDNGLGNPSKEFTDALNLWDSNHGFQLPTPGRVALRRSPFTPRARA